MTELAPGALFGRYRIERRLGGGGFGDVYLATDTNPQLPRRIALKVLKRELARDQSFRDRFMRESQLAIEIDHHPNLVPVYDAGEESGTLFIAMRFVPGQDLQELLAAHGRLSVERCTAVIGGIASALDVAHSMGIVHRDVKPANILVNEDTGEVYLADLGLTRRVDADSKLTMTGMFMGTLSYASPEQLDDQHVDARSDVYSLGCVLFECLTGRAPFVGGLDAVITAHIRQEPPKVTAFRPELDPAIDGVVARALAKRPDDRYQTAGDLGAAATRALRREAQTIVEPGIAAPPPLAPPVPPAPAPPPDLHVSSPQHAPAPPPHPQPPAAPYSPPPAPLTPTSPSTRGSNKKRWIILAAAAAIVALIAGVGAFVVLGSSDSDDPFQSSPSTGSTDESLNADEQALLAHVPEPIRSSCTSESTSSQAIAELSCTANDGDIFLLYDVYADAGDLDAAYEGHRSGIPANSGDPSAGDCPGEGPLTPPDRIVCEDREGAKWLHWTDTGLLIIVAASPYDNAMEWQALIDLLPSLEPK